MPETMFTRSSSRLVPLQRLPAEKALAHRFEHGALRPDLRMAVHARLSGGHASKGGVFDGRVAVAAIDAVVGHVVLVTERNRLFDRLTRGGNVRRAHVQLRREEQQAQADESADQREARETVRAASEYLRHADRSVRTERAEDLLELAEGEHHQEQQQPQPAGDHHAHVVIHRSIPALGAQ